MLNIYFLYLYKVLDFLIIPNYYYYRDGILINISLIIYLLNFLLIGFYLNSYIFEGNIYAKSTLISPQIGWDLPVLQPSPQSAWCILGTRVFAPS